MFDAKFPYVEFINYFYNMFDLYRGKFVYF